MGPGRPEGNVGVPCRVLQQQGQNEPPVRNSVSGFRTIVGTDSSELLRMTATAAAGSLEIKGSVSQSNSMCGSGIPLSPRRHGSGAMVLITWGWRELPALGLQES